MTKVKDKPYKQIGIEIATNGFVVHANTEDYAIQNTIIANDLGELLEAIERLVKTC